jgi:hypothetical protein
MSKFEECPYEPCPVTRETVMDLTPKWWERNRLIQRVRHLLGICEGAGMVMGRECPHCFTELCHSVGAFRYEELPALTQAKTLLRYFPEMDPENAGFTDRAFQQACRKHDWYFHQDGSFFSQTPAVEERK